MLSSDAAKKAAREAAGGDIPENIVPPPTAEVPASEASGDLQALWVVAGADSTSAAQVPEELRDALQSQAVLSALQRSLTVKATELRESLRQWGFAQGATKRTEELCTNLSGAIPASEAEAYRLEEERSRFVMEREADLTSLARLQAEHDSLRARHEASRSSLASASSGAAELEEQRDRSRTRLEEVAKAHGQQARDHEEAARQLEQLRAEDGQHSAEVARRRGAAERLVQRSREQANTAARELGQARQELASFKQAHVVLTEAHQVVLRDLDTERAAHGRLEEEHEALNVELNALARHYMDLLPAGMGGGPPSGPASPLSAAGGLVLRGVA